MNDKTLSAPTSRGTRGLLFVTLATIVCLVLAAFFAQEVQWRFVLTFASVAAIIGLVTLVTSQQPSRSVGRCLLGANLVAAAWFVTQGLYPVMYYMVGFAALLMLWVAVVVGCLFLKLGTATSPSPRVPGKSEMSLVLIPTLVTLLLAFQVPLRLSAVVAIPQLAAKLPQGLKQGPAAEVGERAAEWQKFDCWIYKFRLPGKRRGQAATPVYFQLANDGESAFVHSPDGSDAIVYNEGSKGHLFGDWYWIQED